MAGWGEAGRPIEVTDNATAVERGEVTVLAVPFATVDALLDRAAPALQGRHAW